MRSLIHNRKIWRVLFVFALCLMAVRPVPARAEAVEQYGMLPVYGRDVEDGTYPVSVRSSSGFFRVTDAELTVRGDAMELAFFIPSTSYTFVYPGVIAEAEAADEEERIPAEEVDGRTRFVMDVEALDAAFPCAAYSRRRERWYDRDLLVEASSLPREALHIDLPDYELIGEALDQSGLAASAEAHAADQGGLAASAEAHAADQAVDAEADVWARSAVERARIKYAVLAAAAILAAAGILHLIVRRVRGR